MQHYPRVTLAVIAFNQQVLVGEAIASALAQDYPNLQIVLSDDASSDGTFEVMRAAAAAYCGPHDIVLNQTTGGDGVLAHLLSAASKGDGDLFVGAAGDDVSMPHRVRILVEHWQPERPAIIYSAWNRVDVNGNFLSCEGIEDQHERDLAAYFPGQAGIAAFGCTTAYAMAFLRSVPTPNRPIWSEDYFLSAVAMLTGEGITFVDEALVSYRQNPAALRNFATMMLDYRAYEKRENRFFEGLAGLAQTLLEIIDSGSPAAHVPVNRDDVERDVAWYKYRADWASRSFLQRVRYVAALRSRDRLTWAIPRLPGLRTFLRAKTAMARFRQRS